MKGIRITRKEWDKAKTLLDAGIDRKMAAQLLNRAIDTVRMMENAETYDEYVKNRAELNARKKNPGKQVANNPMVVYAGPVFNDQAVLQEIAGMINDIGIRFHTLAEFLHNYIHDETATQEEERSKTE